MADIRFLASDLAWAAPVPMTGVDLDPDAQVAWLRENVAPFEPEYRGNVTYQRANQGVVCQASAKSKLSVCIWRLAQSQAPPSH